jgi:TolB-like protein
MKRIIVCVLLALFSVKAFPQAVTLDEAINTTALELARRINANRTPNVSTSNQSIEQTAEDIRRQLTAQYKIAVLSFSSDWRELSTYVIDELNTAIVREGSLTLVNKQQLDLVREELDFQGSGDVSDASAQSKGQFLGAQSVLTGSFTKIGNTYRFRVRVITVETAVELYSNSIEIKNDRVLTALTPKTTKAAKAPRDKTDYNFAERLGIGLLNIPLGLGSFIFDDEPIYGLFILGGELGGAFFCAIIGGFAGGENNFMGPIIGAAVGFGIPAMLGFVRAFHMQKPARFAQAFPVDINIVPVSAHNMGVQVSYKWLFN